MQFDPKKRLEITKDDLEFQQQQLKQAESAFRRSPDRLAKQTLVIRRLGACVFDVLLNKTVVAGQNSSANVSPTPGSTSISPTPLQTARQSQQAALQHQARADQQRQGQRKTHDPAAEAHECIAIDKAGSGNYGAFKNQCPYPVNFTTCNEKPRTIQGGFNWSADFDCAKQQFGLHTPKANSSVAAHNRNTEFVHWFACKAPAMPTDGEYIPGRGLVARCYS